MEKDLEKNLTTAAEAVGGMSVKLYNVNFTGLPDRMLLLPVGRIGFVEVKQKGERAKERQKLIHRLLTKLGFKVFLLDDPAQIPAIIREILK